MGASWEGTASDFGPSSEAPGRLDPGPLERAAKVLPGAGHLRRRVVATRFFDHHLEANLDPSKRSPPFHFAASRPGRPGQPAAEAGCGSCGSSGPGRGGRCVVVMRQQLSFTTLLRQSWSVFERPALPQLLIHPQVSGDMLMIFWSCSARLTGEPRRRSGHRWEKGWGGLRPAPSRSSPNR